LNGAEIVHPVPRAADLSQDLAVLLKSFWNPAGTFDLVREHASTAPPNGDAVAVKASLHLARLWANDEIKRLRKMRREQEAIELATRYQLVTPVSGAVVLETDEQYRQTGLEPADPTLVPAIPEPQTWVLLIAGGIVMALALGRKRNRR
jgi:hypothetical protein